MDEKRAGWTVSGAKARFNEVIARAVAEGPQAVSRNGRDTAVVVSVDQSRRAKARKGNLAEFFANAPFKGLGDRPGPRRRRAAGVGAVTASGYPIDTNVVSESVTTRPDLRVMRWLAEVDEDRAFLSVATVADIRCGVERTPQGRRRDRLEAWLEDEPLDRFAGRLLGVDLAVGDV